MKILHRLFRRKRNLKREDFPIFQIAQIKNKIVKTKYKKPLVKKIKL